MVAAARRISVAPVLLLTLAYAICLDEIRRIACACYNWHKSS